MIIIIVVCAFVFRMEKVYDFIGLPPQHVLENHEPRNARNYEPITQETRARLKAFYQPYNEKLVEVLGSIPVAWSS